MERRSVSSGQIAGVTDVRPIGAAVPSVGVAFAAQPTRPVTYASIHDAHDIVVHPFDPVDRRALNLVLEVGTNGPRIAEGFTRGKVRRSKSHPTGRAIAVPLDDVADCKQVTRTDHSAAALTDWRIDAATS